MQKRFLDAGFRARTCTCSAPIRASRISSSAFAPPAASTKSRCCFSATWTWWRRCAPTGTPIPFEFVEKDGYFYGRGTQDMKDSDAALVATFLRLHREGYKPKRDLILALTADEEGGKFNGADWLVQQHRDLVDAAYRHQSRLGRRGTRPWTRRGGRCRGHRKGLFRFPGHGHQSRRPQLAAPAGQRHLRADHGAEQAGRLHVSVRAERGHAHLFRESRRAGDGPDGRGHARHPRHSARYGRGGAAERRAQLQLELSHHLRGHAARRPATPTTRCRRPPRPT